MFVLSFSGNSLHDHANDVLAVAGKRTCCKTCVPPVAITARRRALLPLGDMPDRLERYREMRDFTITPNPQKTGGSSALRRKSKGASLLHPAPRGDAAALRLSRSSSKAC